MCGIFAVLGLEGDPLRNRKRVYALARRIRHRGPDSYSMDVQVDEAAGKGRAHGSRYAAAERTISLVCAPSCSPHDERRALGGEVHASRSSQSE